MAANEESNLTCGVAAVAEALERCVELSITIQRCGVHELPLYSDVEAALCVLAMNDSELTDPAERIYFKLIEAFCMEYGIHLLKVGVCTCIVCKTWVVDITSSNAGRQQLAFG
jgi:hypothetical protein